MTVGNGVAYVTNIIEPLREMTEGMRRPDSPTQSSLTPPTGSSWEATTGSQSKARHRAFRILAAILTVAFLALFVFGLFEVVLMWLPDEVLLSVIDDLTAADLEFHRAHFLSIGIVAWALVPALAVQLRKPERRVAPMLQLTVIVVVSSVVFGLSGTLGDWLVEEAAILVPVLLLAWLHPRARDLINRPAFDRGMVTLAAVAALPWLAFSIDNARLQITGIAGDPRPEEELWAAAAMMGVAIAACAIIGSSDRAGWPLPAWTAAAGSVIFGLHSLVYRDAASTLPIVWAVLAIVWGVGLGVMIVRRQLLREPEHAS
ncbi:MAG: hypothetical protein ABFR53_03340 [Actinomycetota bacterium]